MKDKGDEIMQQYTVQQGDTLASIARRFGITPQQLAAANNLSVNAQLMPGQIIYVPDQDNNQMYDNNMMGDNGMAVDRRRPERPGQPGGNGQNQRPTRPTRPERPPQPVQPSFPVYPVPLPTPVEPSYPAQEYFCPILRPGSRGSVVILLQQLLRARGYYRGPEDGVYNARLQQSVRRFQEDNGIFGSGIVDRRTWGLLGVYCGSLPPIAGGMPVNTGTSRGLRQILYTNRRVYRQGQTVQINLSKTNITNNPISLRYSTSQLIEIVVRNIYNQEVWRYSDNRVFTPLTRLITIMPDGTQTINESWNQTDSRTRRLVPPGIYIITVQNLATGLSLSVQIEIN